MAPSAHVEAHELASLRSLRFNYTKPGADLEVFYRINLDRCNSLFVVGVGADASYEWVLINSVGPARHSDCGYGGGDVALRDGLIEALGPGDGDARIVTVHNESVNTGKRL